MSWVHRVPVPVADERRVVVTDTQGNEFVIRVRLESSQGGRNIVLMLDDPARLFQFRVQRADPTEVRCEPPTSITTK